MKTEHKADGQFEKHNLRGSWAYAEMARQRNTEGNLTTEIEYKTWSVEDEEIYLTDHVD